jgi:tRNA threonylcarbamoyladenosine biosynthesis protein TsaB
MTILGIETSTAVCSVGLANESGPIAEKSIVESHIHSEKLLTLVNDICGEQKFKLKQIDSIAISIGPGSFTGLRIGLSTAKGLCYALGKPLITVPTFDAIASAVLEQNTNCKHTAICIDAKQGEYYIGVYEKTDGVVKAILPVKVGDVASIQIPFSDGTIYVSDRIDELKLKKTEIKNPVNVVPYCRGDIVAYEAAKIQKSTEGNNWHSIEPMYLKDFVVKKHGQ